MNHFYQFLKTNFQGLSTPDDILRAQTAAALEGDEVLNVGYHSFVDENGDTLSKKFLVPASDVLKFLCLGEDRLPQETLCVFPTPIPAPIIEAVQASVAAQEKRELAPVG